MYKKSIVLLITISFIATISILILKNLQDTDKFLNELSYDSSLSQIQITIDNVRKEIPGFLKKNKDNIDEILENTEVLPFTFGNIDILLNIENYTLPQFNINELNTSTTSSEDFINNVNYQYDFLELVDKNKPYTNKKQIKQTIQEYIKLTKDKDILKIKDDFTYIKANEQVQLIKCDYTIKVDDLTCKVYFIFELDSLAIKDFNIVNIF
jgi:hypothetical protein